MGAFVIWSWEHDAWWGPDECGYVSDLKAAGRYSLSDAGRIAAGSHVEEVAIQESVAAERGAPRFHPYRGASR